MRIAIDAMGSDTYPMPDVEGAILAAQEFNDTIVIVGDQDQIQREIAKHSVQNAKIEIAHASQLISMHDKPSIVGKDKPDSSMHVGMNLVKNGQADAFVTAGNTGAALAIATLFTLHRIPGIKRPALGSIVRIPGNRSIILLDIGANADCKSDWLMQFAIMGKIYSQNASGIPNPRIAILANGEEEGKGNQLIHEATQLLKASNLNFVGNIEPKEMLQGNADVIVSDGFVGNIAIKSIEAMGSALSNLIRDEIRRDPISTIGGLLARAAFRRVYKQVDPFEIGGAPLLGVNGVVIIGHGRSNAKAIKNAIRQARMTVIGRVVQSIQEGIKDVSVNDSGT
ncbi:MAG: phosphate acyltransferase PlsX [Chloroflexota bacterium]